MRFGLHGASRRFADPYGGEWILSPVEVSARGSDDSASNDPRDPRTLVATLVSHAFDSGGARSDAIASALLEVYDALTGHHLADQLPTPTQDPRRLLAGFDTAMRAALFQALDRNQIRIGRVERGPWPFPDQPQAPPPSTPDPGPTETTFIEIRLVDEDGNPMPNHQYQITLPDGSARQGAVGSDGTARVDGITTPGQCTVQFPDLVQDWGAPSSDGSGGGGGDGSGDGGS